MTKATFAGGHHQAPASMEIPEIMEAVIRDRRVTRALEASYRDVTIRRGFVLLRERGDQVDDAVAFLGKQFGLSEERIRSIVYDK